jgi:hypothetical protein
MLDVMTEEQRGNFLSDTKVIRISALGVIAGFIANCDIACRSVSSEF